MKPPTERQGLEDLGPKKRWKQWERTKHAQKGDNSETVITGDKMSKERGSRVTEEDEEQQHLRPFPEGTSGFPESQ